ncbi:hypothetical protein DSECCO2_615610 [anaerobic digester metagenome]
MQPPAPDDPDGVGLDHPVRQVDHSGEEPGEDGEVGVGDREVRRSEGHGDPDKRYKDQNEACDEERPLLRELFVLQSAEVGHHAGYTNVPCLSRS